MASTINRGTELLMAAAEKAYNNHDYIRSLEIAMTAYGATASIQAKRMIDLSIKAIDGSPAPIQPAINESKVKLELHQEERVDDRKRVEVALPMSSMVESVHDLFSSSASITAIPTDLSVTTEPEKANEKMDSTIPVLVPAAETALSVVPPVPPDEETKKASQLTIVYPAMNSKDPDQLYIEALKEADVDAAMGLNRAPKLSPEEQVIVDDRTARNVIDSRDFFEMVDMNLWSDVHQVERAFKKAILRVHPDKNKSAMAEQAAETLNAEYKKFKAEPRKYTIDIEKRRFDTGEYKSHNPTDPHEGYGNGSGERSSSDGFDCYGKRSYTWAAANSGPKRHVDMNPEGNGSMYSDPRGQAAWLDAIEYSEATAHKFRKGKLQSFSQTGESASKTGTRFIAKNNY